MSVDLRAFEYALEPLLRQRTWKLESLRTQLASVQRDIDAIRQARARLAEERRTLSEETVLDAVATFDPGRHARRLLWLVQLQSRIVEQDAWLDRLQADRASLAERCVREQRGIDAIEAHKEEAVQQYGRDVMRAVANEADRDWLARAASCPAAGVAASESGA